MGDNVARQTWLATDLEVSNSENSQVVVKLLAFGGQVQWENLKLFEREAQVLKQLNHARIPKYRDYFCIDERLLGFGLVEGYLPGSSFKELLAQGKKFTEQQVRKIAVDVLNILIYLHELNRSVLHRDIKPSNLILDEDEQVYLVDFGAVQDKAAKEGATFTIVGTYGYTPMEQFGGRAVPASDLYALGATLIHLLTGTAPADLPQQDLRIQFSDRVSLSPSLVFWIEKLTEPAPERRFNTARQALEVFKLNRTPSPVRSICQPASSRVQITKSASQLLIELPRQRMCTFELLGFSSLMLLIGAIGLSILTVMLFALVRSPFFGFGILLIFLMVWYKFLAGILISTFGHHYISFDRNHFAIEWRIFSFCHNRKQGLTTEIQDIFQSVLQIGQESIFQLESNAEKEMVTIQTPEKRYSFGVGLTALECVWLAQEIKGWLKSSNSRLKN